MDPHLLDTLSRIAAALERLAPPPPRRPELDGADAFVWHPANGELAPVQDVSRVEIEMLHGIDRQKRLVADSDKLLALATQLHDDVGKTDKNILSLDVVKRAEEIEKLARAVKERMKG